MGFDCENKFCIYFESGKCILDSVSLDELGVCTKLLYVDIEEDFLAFKRKKLLEKYEQLNF